MTLSERELTEQEEQRRRLRETPLLDRQNNLHPDDLHRSWLERNHYQVLEDGSLRQLSPEAWEAMKRGCRGRPKGCRGRCSICGEIGHNARTCGHKRGDEKMINEEELLSSQWRYRGVVQRVVDGDTVDAILDLGFTVQVKVRLRLGGIDAWETRGEERPKGLRAKMRVRELVEGREVYVVSAKTGKYGRWIGYIWTIDAETGEPAIFLNRALLDEGHATEY